MVIEGTHKGMEAKVLKTGKDSHFSHDLNEYITIELTKSSSIV